MRNEEKVYRDRVEQQVVGQLFFQEVIDVDRSKTRFSGVRKIVAELAVGCCLCPQALQAAAVATQASCAGLETSCAGTVRTSSFSISFAAVQAISEQLERLDNGDCWYTVSEPTLYNVSHELAQSLPSIVATRAVYHQDPTSGLCLYILPQVAT